MCLLNNFHTHTTSFLVISFHTSPLYCVVCKYAVRVTPCRSQTMSAECILRILYGKVKYEQLCTVFLLGVSQRNRRAHNIFIYFQQSVVFNLNMRLKILSLKMSRYGYEGIILFQKIKLVCDKARYCTDCEQQNQQSC